MKKAMLKAKIKTKSNYRNLNGQWLPVKECKGTRVSCIIETEIGQQTADFDLSEIAEMDYSEKQKSNIKPVFEQALKPFMP